MEQRRERDVRDLSGLRIQEQERGEHGLSKGIIALLIIAISALAGVTAWVVFRNRVVQVEVVVARAAAASGGPVMLNASGYVTPRQRATVASKVTGQVKAIMVEEGMLVEKDQILALLDDADAKLQLEAARTAKDVAQAAIQDITVNLENAQRELHRIRGLRSGGFASEQELDAATTAVDSLKAKLKLAQEQVRAADAQKAVAQQSLDNYTVRAPFSGVVVSKDAQVGEMISPISSGGYTRTGIATIVDMNSLEIEVDVNESYIARVTSEQRAEAILDAYPEWRIPARVRAIIPTADRQKATVKVRLNFDSLDARILPDMGIKVTFFGEELPDNSAEVPKALIPQACVQELEGKPVVFVVRDGKVERRAIKTGRPRAGDVEVIAGLNPGDKVVLKAPTALADGQEVSIKP